MSQRPLASLVCDPTKRCSSLRQVVCCVFELPTELLSQHLSKVQRSFPLIRRLFVAYRRDRRKDRLLQQNGYLVVRFLAEDLGKIWTAFGIPYCRFWQDANVPPQRVKLASLVCRRSRKENTFQASNRAKVLTPMLWSRILGRKIGLLAERRALGARATLYNGFRF